MTIKNVDVRIGDGPADANRLGAAFDPGEARPDCRLGRPVHVPQDSDPAQHIVGEVAWQAFAPAQRAKPRPSVPAGLNKLPPRRGRRLHYRRAALFEPHLEEFSVGRGLLVDHLDPGADQKRQVELKARDVE